MRLRSLIRGVYTVLAVMVALALLSGRDDPATNLFLSLAALPWSVGERGLESASARNNDAWLLPFMRYTRFTPAIAGPTRASWDAAVCDLPAWVSAMVACLV